MIEDGRIFLGAGASGPQWLELRYANRHGLVAGATGTGKTISLRIMAESFSAAGVPVFAADIKGDLSGIGLAGSAEGKAFLAKRAEEIGFAQTYRFEGFPVAYWDLFGRQGHPVRATISEMGPLLLSRLLDLNDTQEGVINVAFNLADEQKLLLLDLKDLRAMLTFIAEQAEALRTTYGNISAASVGAIQRKLLTLENEGAAHFFGEPALELSDFMRVDSGGRGVINLLAADQLMASPKLYATFLLWLLSELFETLPEVGDLDKPKLVFFFDEAHLLFNDAPKALLEKVTQVVRLVRSKGVGVYFVTQNPADIPEPVLAQLGNRIQHALRAYTPAERKAIRAAAESFRPNPAFKTEDAITELAVGEALVSTLQDKGVPGIVERTLIRPPSSRLEPLSAAERAAALAGSAMAGKYDHSIDRHSAYEMLQARAESGAKTATAAEPSRSSSVPPSGPWGRQKDAEEKRSSGAATKRGSRAPARPRSDSMVETTMKSVLRTAGREITRSIVRGLLGSLRR
jgi:DNA helicase HerA-like ATPase